MKPADRRARLYDHNKDRPRVERVQKSSAELFKWVRTAQHLKGNSYDEEEFIDFVDSSLAEFDEVYFIHDRHPKFSGGIGPMGVVGVKVNGQNREPHVEWFPWASPRNILRCAVSFFMLFRRKGMGTMIVYALSKDKAFYDHLSKYVPLFPAGKIPDGDPMGRGDEYRYYIQGRGKS